MMAVRNDNGSMTSMRATVALFVLAASCHTKPQLGPPPKKVVPLPQVVKGASIRPVGDRRRGYGTAAARQTMKRLQSMGVNTIGVLLEGRMEDLRSTEIMALTK